MRTENRSLGLGPVLSLLAVRDGTSPTTFLASWSPPTEQSRVCLWSLLSCYCSSCYAWCSWSLYTLLHLENRLNKFQGLYCVPEISRMCSRNAVHFTPNAPQMLRQVRLTVENKTLEWQLQAKASVVLAAHS